MRIIRSPHGTKRREIDVDKIEIPDLWHLAMELSEHDQTMVLEVWHLAHDMLMALRGDPDYLAEVTE